jgi:UDP-N-acetylmuramate dehydrogenase
MNSSLEQVIRESFPAMEIRRNEALAQHTSFKIGGPASLMLFPKTGEELKAVYKLLLGERERPVILGNGSNVLAPEAGLDRAVIITTGVCNLSVKGSELTADCGVPLSRAAVIAAAEGLSGLECLYGIPGTIGGALVMNAGAYGGEIKDVVYKTEYLNAYGETCFFIGDEHGFGYRTSAFKAEDVILSTSLRLKEAESAAIKETMNTLMEKRKTSQPLDLPSAGSAFKRPKGGYAAELIDKAGLKGFKIGGAEVSVKHAGFIVNRGWASSTDVLRLIEHIQKIVYTKYGIELTPEIRILG